MIRWSQAAHEAHDNAAHQVAAVAVMALAEKDPLHRKQYMADLAEQCAKYMDAKAALARTIRHEDRQIERALEVMP